MLRRSHKQVDSKTVNFIRLIARNSGEWNEGVERLQASATQIASNRVI